MNCSHDLYRYLYVKNEYFKKNILSGDMDGEQNILLYNMYKYFNDNLEYIEVMVTRKMRIHLEN